MAEVHSCVNKTFITIFIGIAIGFFIFGAWLLITGLVQIGQENYSYISILCIVCSIFPMIGGWIILDVFIKGCYKPSKVYEMELYSIVHVNIYCIRTVNFSTNIHPAFLNSGLFFRRTAKTGCIASETLRQKRWPYFKFFRKYVFTIKYRESWIKFNSYFIQINKNINLVLNVCSLWVLCQNCIQIPSPFQKQNIRRMKICNQISMNLSCSIFHAQV